VKRDRAVEASGKGIQELRYDARWDDIEVTFAENAGFVMWRGTITQCYKPNCFFVPAGYRHLSPGW
jgi:hypothetical protein